MSRVIDVRTRDESTSVQCCVVLALALIAIPLCVGFTLLLMLV